MPRGFTPSWPHQGRTAWPAASGATAGGEEEEEDHQGDRISELEAEKAGAKKSNKRRRGEADWAVWFRFEPSVLCCVWEPPDAQLSPLCPLFISLLTHFASELDSTGVFNLFYLTASSCFPQTSSPSIPCLPPQHISPFDSEMWSRFNQVQSRIWGSSGGDSGYTTF